MAKGILPVLPHITAHEIMQGRGHGLAISSGLRHCLD